MPNLLNIIKHFLLLRLAEFVIVVVFSATYAIIFTDQVLAPGESHELSNNLIQDFLLVYRFIA